MNISTDNPDVRVRRVKVTEQVERALKPLAKKFGFLYREQISISRLLNQIGEGSLELNRPKHIPSNYVGSNVYLLELDIEVISNLNGTIAEIANKIAINNGNIYQAQAKENRNVLQILLSIPKDCKLTKLFKDLQSIVIGDVRKFNEGQKLERLLETLDSKEKKIYDYYKNKKTKNIEEANKLLEELTSDLEYQNKSLITSIVCTIKFQIDLENKSGTLDKLLHQIRDKKISVLEIEIDFDPKKDLNIVSLYLGFYPTFYNETYDKIESIQKLMNTLKKLSYVKNVKQLSTNY